MSRRFTLHAAFEDPSSDPDAPPRQVRPSDLFVFLSRVFLLEINGENAHPVCTVYGDEDSFLFSSCAFGCAHVF
eukprot:1632103-Rhodomonas_salina.1